MKAKNSRNSPPMAPCRANDSPGNGNRIQAILADAERRLPNKANLTLQEVAVFFSCSVYTIRRRINAGDLESIPWGAGVRIPRASVLSFYKSAFQAGQKNGVVK